MAVAWGQRGAPAAFFDVDDTLMRGFTLVSFIHFMKEHLDNDRLVADLAELERLAPTYHSREALITDCFRLLAGQSWSQMIRWGQQWYQLVGRDLLVPTVLARLHEHRQRGHTVVFVSGSWFPCLIPAAADLGVDYVYCCQVDVAEGLLTGTTRTVMTGSVKAETVRDFTARHRIELSQCYAYGDDITDTEMLSLVGHPVAVHPSPELTDVALDRSWNVLIP